MSCPEARDHVRSSSFSFRVPRQCSIGSGRECPLGKTSSQSSGNPCALIASSGVGRRTIRPASGSTCTTRKWRSAPRRLVSGIVYVIRNGLQWNDAPAAQRKFGVDTTQIPFKQRAFDEIEGDEVEAPLRETLTPNDPDCWRQVSVGRTQP